ncbi:hypothetical protein MSKU15_3524 [Komagataeibacter diospyri]|nr:hypothetical protein MSKU15_3524 [Komagataeibacter diospyri]
MATGNVNLNAVTDSQSSYTRTVEHGFLNRTTTTSSESSTDQVGSTVAANDNVTMVSGRDMSVAGTVAGGGDVTLQAGGTFTENALKDTAQSAYSQEKSGLFVGTSGAGFEVGFGKSRQTANDSSTTWTSSEIGSTGGDVTVAAGGPVTINASGLEAAKDLNVSGSSVSFNALNNVAKDSQTSDSSFIGLKAGLSDNSVVGQVADMALSAAQAANDKDTGNRTLDAASAGISGATAGISVAKALSEDAKSGEVELVGVSAEVGFSHDRQAESSTTTTVQGSTAAAGDGLTVTATGAGDGTTDSNAGDIIATASQLSGQTVTLNAPGTVTLQSGQDTTHTTSSQSSESAFIGATASLNADAQWGVSVTGQVGGSHAQSDARSATQVDSTVTGTDNVTVNNAGGATTLDGAKVSGGSVDVTTGSLDITSAQNTASYSSNQESGGFSFAIPVYGVGGEKGFSVNASGGALGDTYASTEASGLSGIHAGNGGVNIAVAGNTSLDAGVIESTAASALNSFTTGSLTASGEKNVSDYAGASASFSYSTMQGGGDTGEDNSVPLTQGLADNGIPMTSAAAVAGSHETESQSAIGSNITVETGATSGSLSRDPSTANQAIANDFDASKESNVLALANEAETVTQAAAWTAKLGYDMASAGSKEVGTTVSDNARNDAISSANSSESEPVVRQEDLPAPEDKPVTRYDPSLETKADNYRSSMPLGMPDPQMSEGEKINGKVTEFSLSPDHYKVAIRVVANRPHSLAFDKGISGKDFASVIAPPLSTIIAGADAYHDLREGNYAPALLNAAIAGLGVLPMTGDAAELASIAKVGERAARTGSKAAGNIVENGVDVAEVNKIEKSFVFRGVDTAPETTFRDGFSPHGDSMDLLAHVVDSSNPPSGFISTSKNFDVASSFGSNVSVISRPANAIDVNAALGMKNPFPGEEEVAVPGKISGSQIRAITIISKNISILNPGYVP